MTNKETEEARQLAAMNRKAADYFERINQPIAEALRDAVAAIELETDGLWLAEPLRQQSHTPAN